MPLTKCPRSGKLFNSDDGPVHPECMAEEEADYEKVREYLRTNPHAHTKEVVEKSGVEIDCIQRMVDQGMLKQLSEEEVQEQIKRQLTQKDLQRLNAEFAKQISQIHLPDKKEVEFGGTVRSALSQKRRGF